MNEQEIHALVRHRLGQAQVALEDAKFLFDGQRSPQSIINRAYYAMFYAALALLQQAGKVPSKHAGVISIFDTEFVAKGVFAKDFSKSLHRAFELRQTSDYKIIDSVTREEAEEVLRQAARFVEAVRVHLSKGATNLP